MPLAIGWFVWGGLLGVLYLIAFITAGVMTIPQRPLATNPVRNPRMKTYAEVR
jgi:hypothetical protein